MKQVLDIDLADFEQLRTGLRADLIYRLDTKSFAELICLVQRAGIQRYNVGRLGFNGFSNGLVLICHCQETEREREREREIRGGGG